jgi:hypothetical protein
MTPAQLEQRRSAQMRSTDLRVRRSAAKRRLRSGDLLLTDAMSDPPPELADMLLIDVIRALGTRRSASIVELGRMAVADRVNLMVPLGSASARTRAWVAQHGGRWTSLGERGTPGRRSRSATRQAREATL